MDGYQKLFIGAFLVGLSVIFAAGQIGQAIDRAAERCAPTALEAG